MASMSATYVLFFIIVLVSVSLFHSSTVVEDLVNLHPPPDFNTTITTNCLNNPSLRYCNASPTDLQEIFRFTIVASHLCNESKNPNCVESFSKIDLQGCPKIAPLYLSFSFFWKYCPLSILTINLSNNSLKGSFPTDVLLCTQIHALDFSHNDLSGDVPIQSFSPLTNLTGLNLSYNHFSESKISDTKFFRRFNSSSFIHSGLLPDHESYKIKAIVLLVGFPVLVILIVSYCLAWLCLQRPDFLPRVLTRKHKFTPAMLKAVTQEFSTKNLLGKTGGIALYKGILRDGTEVRIEIYSDKVSSEVRHKFVEECKVLVQLSHKNLVRVLGWCNNPRLRALVTDWIDGENVETWLSGSAPPWKHRLKVLMGVLAAMCYLQEEWAEVGYDLRTSSLLLSNNQDPLISRFKVGDQSNTRRKIYKFGVFLLEIITNMRPADDFEGAEAGMIHYIRLHYPGNLGKVIDKRMKLTENTLDQAEQGIGLGLMCIDQSSSKQPNLNQISNMIVTAYESCQRRSHGDGGDGHRHEL